MNPGLSDQTGSSASKGAEVRDFVRLLKPRVMSLVVFSGFAGLFVAPGSIHPFLAAVAVLCIAVGAGAAGAINMWFDRDIDAIMVRTRGRPIPRGKVAPDDALAFGTVLSLGSVLIMALAVNYVAAGLLAVAILFYVFIYTMWLKRSTPQNIVIGGAAGAFPPMIGWAAVTGGVSLESVVLFGLIFLWTPPHFWALALYRRGDYADAGVPMLPVVAGVRETKKQMFIYTILLFPCAIAPYWLGVAGPLYGMAAAVLGGLFVLSSIAVWRDESDKSAKRMFGYSIFYLFALFGAMILDRGVGLIG
ncbi:MAG TPA: protoheme IX farnesyltransferase [Rhodospirillaceae bacterium]|nr:protoheme IX farnesyltransferase [Rhodospirillaceae bacterium]MAX64725.1 protoheme IX farnesyltransferase [Rhodospirillaceae bacterium]MBB58697.1 protoheme IX farnesyltransferase [Rhodospirillaceae bacterium]HAJ19691.1 protoheme IX farnesyltransferase [Rhodospirillaceae bacterium]